MSTSSEENGTTVASEVSEQPKAAKKARVAKQGTHVAPKKGRSGKKPTPAKKASNGQKKPAGAREGSKTSRVVELLKRQGGATLKELMKASGWQPHSVRGFLSGTVRKRMGLAIVSSKGEDGERSYSVRV